MDPLTMIGLAAAGLTTIGKLADAGEVDRIREFADAIRSLFAGAATPEQVAMLDQNLVRIAKERQAETDAILAKLRAIENAGAIQP